MWKADARQYGANERYAAFFAFSLTAEGSGGSFFEPKVLLNPGIAGLREKKIQM